MNMRAALFIHPAGPYANRPGIDAWDKDRDARLYAGPWPVIAHPPCERWGRYWFGGPSVKVRRELGDDDGCFKAALASVRKWGGLIEHPEGSHAWRAFGLPIPDFNGGWTQPDLWGGRACCVAQGHYGHRAQKMTWLYKVGEPYPELIWGRFKGGVRIDLGYHSAEERRRAIKTGVGKRLSKRQRTLTPEPFAELLISIVVPGLLGG